MHAWWYSHMDAANAWLLQTACIGNSTPHTCSLQSFRNIAQYPWRLDAASEAFSGHVLRRRWLLRERPLFSRSVAALSFPRVSLVVLAPSTARAALAIGPRLTFSGTAISARKSTADCKIASINDGRRPGREGTASVTHHTPFLLPIICSSYLEDPWNSISVSPSQIVVSY